MSLSHKIMGEDNGCISATTLPVEHIVECMSSTGSLLIGIWHTLKERESENVKRQRERPQSSMCNGF